MTSQANGATRAHVETTPRPQCHPSGRLGVEDTWRSRDTIDLFRSALAPNSQMCWIADSHAAAVLLALTSPPERAPLRASRSGESAHQLLQRCDTPLCNLF